jgi:hypothetical protein
MTTILNYLIFYSISIILKIYIKLINFFLLMWNEEIIKNIQNIISMILYLIICIKSYAKKRNEKW